MDENQNRRSFLKQSAKTVVGAGIVGTAVHLIQGCGKSPSSSEIVQTVDTNSNQIATLEYSDFPNLQTVNGSYKVDIRNGSTTTRVYVTRVGTGTAKAVTTVCTHQRCDVGAWDGSSYPCPCHGSSYSSDGSVITGPAVTSLTSYTSTVTNAGIEVLMA